MKRSICFILLLLMVESLIDAAPSPAALLECLNDDDCQVDSGPVCAIDEAGQPQTFDNRCTARLAFCRFGSYYAEVKPGEC